MSNYDEQEKLHELKRGLPKSMVDALQAAPPSPPARQQAVHDHPACAIFRGGKCTCDEADKLCPQCGTEEWDRVTAERGRERDVPFNRCCQCNNEWAAS